MAQEAPFETNPFLLLGGQRAFSVLVKEVDIRTSLPVSGTLNSMRREAKNSLDQCIDLKVNGISLSLDRVLYVDDILLSIRAVARDSSFVGPEL